MADNTEVREHKVGAMCTARFGSEGQKIRGTCAWLHVKESLERAGHVYEYDGFTPGETTTTCEGKCVFRELYRLAERGRLPSPDKIIAMRCSNKVTGVLKARREKPKTRSRR